MNYVIRPGGIVACMMSLLIFTACSIDRPRANALMNIGSPVERSLHDWADKSQFGIFAISLDGRSFSDTVCAKSVCSAEDELFALDSCLKKSQGSKCIIYARNGKYIWNDEPIRPPAKASANGEKKGDTLRGIRQLAFSWEGYATSTNVTMRFEEDGRNGTIELMLPDRVKCSGNYGFYDIGAGNWFLRCENELTASGTFQKTDHAGGVMAFGRDSRDRRITSIVSD
jgi:hypothetical protein